MNPRGNLISRAAAMALMACFAASASPSPGWAASHQPVAIAAKKCKRKHHRRKRRCKHRSAPASISITPTSEDFGMPSLGNEPTRMFTVANAGGSVSGVPVAMIGGPTAGSFEIVANTCTTPLSPLAACRIDVKLPFRDPVGMKSATLTVVAVPGGTVSAAMTGDVEI
jgi:hypothetical protein